MTTIDVTRDPSLPAKRTEPQKSIQEITDAYRPSNSIRWGHYAKHGVLMSFSLVVLLPLAWVIIRSIVSLPDGTRMKSCPRTGQAPFSSTTTGSSTNDPKCAGTFRTALWLPA